MLFQAWQFNLFGVISVAVKHAHRAYTMCKEHETGLPHATCCYGNRAISVRIVSTSTLQPLSNLIVQIR